MDYNSDCRIYAARAFAEIPTSVLDIVVPYKLVGVSDGGLYPVCSLLPVGGEAKRREIAFEG